MATSMWHRTEEMAKKHDQAGGTWLKLAGEGDKAVVVFLGEPFPREVCFIDGKYAPFTAELRAQGLKASLRVALNVALLDSREVKVFEQGVVFFKDLVRVRDKYGLGKWAFEVQRHGAAKDPKTFYSLLPERALTAEEQRTFAALQLHDLVGLYSEDGGGAGGSSQGGGAPTGGGGPVGAPVTPEAIALIDAATATSMGVVLRGLPKEAVECFCKRFAISRIRDLPAAHTADAIAYLDELGTQFAPRPPGHNGGDIDPFS